MALSILQLQAMGMDATALCEWQQGDKTFLLHHQIAEPLTRLQEDAKAAGFDLQIVSAYRDFDRQLSIWNAKAEGKRQLLNGSGQAIDFHTLSPEQRLYAIMRWSAVPGLSRHHWGTDIDIFDNHAMNINDVKLIPQEVEGNGPCVDMHRWLGERIAANKSYGFYRPYQFDNGGIAPEMWHISYLPTANIYRDQLDQYLIQAIWKEKKVLLREELIANLTSIWPVYVQLETNRQPEWVQKTLS